MEYSVTDPLLDGSFDAFGTSQYASVGHTALFGASDIRSWSRENPHVQAYEGLSSDFWSTISYLINLSSL